MKTQMQQVHEQVTETKKTRQVVRKKVVNVSAELNELMADSNVVDFIDDTVGYVAQKMIDTIEEMVEFCDELEIVTDDIAEYEDDSHTTKLDDLHEQAVGHARKLIDQIRELIEVPHARGAWRR